MWTPTELASNLGHRKGTAWRVVEFQYAASTRKLVETKDEQDLLEDILEQSKPPLAPGTEHLHYLLKTPFRYDAPYPFGSRFRRANPSEGVFYASEEIRTALAELCYFRLRFFNESPDTPLPRQHERLTAFSIIYASHKIIDITRPPFDVLRDIWTHPTDYQATQAFADTARQAGADIIRYKSVRDAQAAANIALLSPTAFASPVPKEQQTWFLYLSKTEANCERANSDSKKGEQWTFKYSQFSTTQ